jgi:hypothetical protein
MPHRDLLLSPHHAVFTGGVLIPIRHLINGTTIAQVEVDEITYWHVELESHDVILAEGLPCESYLDTGNRSAFANGGVAVQLHPNFTMRVWEAESCAKLVAAGPELADARRMLLERAELPSHEKEVIGSEPEQADASTRSGKRWRDTHKPFDCFIRKSGVAQEGYPRDRAPIRRVAG